MMTVADIANGNTGLADALFLAAFIVAVAAMVIGVMHRAVPTVALAASVALIALGFMVL